MRINIGKITFDTKFAPKDFGSKIFFKSSGGSYYQCKKVVINPWNKVHLLIRSIQIFSNTNILILKVIRMIYLLKSAN